MDESTVKNLQRAVNTYQELVDIVVEKMVEVPKVNQAMRDILGEDMYQQLSAKLGECGQADAIAAAYIR